MTDSVITDTCPPADTNHVPTQPSSDDTQPTGEFHRNFRNGDVETTGVDPTPPPTNGHDDVYDTSGKTFKAPNVDGSYGNLNGLKPIVNAEIMDFTKMSSSDLRTHIHDSQNGGNSNPNIGNSSSSAAIPLTNGHVDM